MKKPPILNAENDWAMLPKWKKRLVGFATYSIAAFCSIIELEVVDWVLYNDLKSEFVNPEKKAENE
jgi:hypothetical protein